MREKIYFLLEKFVDIEDDYSNFKKEVIHDYITAVVSREVSLMARKEVLSGKAKFGITGDGKELPQLALAKAFQKGDWKAGYYRDQTFMLSKGLMTVEEYFSQLYADCDNDPFSGGRQMNNHFATDTYDSEGNWLDLRDLLNISSDISCTGGQVARAVGHAFASKVFRSLDEPTLNHLSNNGNEVCFLTIGEGSTSEGAFWEMMNAAGVLDIPLVAVVYDDGFSISVPVELQTTKSSISKAMEGLLIDENGKGIHIYVAKAWDYQELCMVFQKAADIARRDHKAVLIHVQECTQPQGHSTSGSHERYKTESRLEWENEFDCILKMEEWIMANAILTQEEIEEIGASAKQIVKEGIKHAWAIYENPIKDQWVKLGSILDGLPDQLKSLDNIKEAILEIKKLHNPFYSDLHSIGRRVLHFLRTKGLQNQELADFVMERSIKADLAYHSKLHSETPKAALNQIPVNPIYDEKSALKTGYQIINAFFDHAFEERKDLIAFGEDLGLIGDVNQGFTGLQEKYGNKRIMDTGIREWTIVGQALGASMRGIKPIVEIQYLDYLGYAFSPLSDDVATLRYRTDGLQRAPMIVRTRGHRLEGIWHAGSPMGMIINGMRGIYLCVPHNFVQAAGMYNTLLDSDDPGIVVECLNAYRLKERVPNNLSEIKLPLGVPNVLLEGNDVTVVTYGACVRVVQKAAEMLQKFNISIEIIDAQTLMPFDIEHRIVESLKKTNKLICVDEDLPGGASAYMMREILETQNGYNYLDSKPVCLSAKDHRTPYGSDGDYYTKPNPDTVFEAIYKMMHESNPGLYP